MAGHLMGGRLRKWLCAVVLLALSPAGIAHADVSEAGSSGFTVTHEASVPGAPLAAYEAIGQIGQWWADAHTYSGDAGNMSLPLQAGSCFCETWAAGSVAHGRLLLAVPGQFVRLEAPLGPLQEMAVSTSMTFLLTGERGGTRIRLVYVASGREGQGLDSVAPAVDQVLGEQMTRLQRFLAAQPRP
ncbi:MAG: ATPase [Alphaproteobacteria bacterium]|nr:ATPase [Alphaproteobacteria bacterium]